MSGVATAVIGGAVISGVVQDNASRRAVDAQKDATRRSMDVQERMFEQQREDQQPWMQAGESALNALMGEYGLSYGDQPELGQTVKAGVGTQGFAVPGPKQFDKGAQMAQTFNPGDLAKDAGYQFRLAEGEKALERSAAARGGLNSAATMKALMGYGQGLASEEYGNAYNRFTNERAFGYGKEQDRLNRLASLAGVGQSAVNTLGASAQQYGSSMGNALMGMGNAQASSAIAQGNTQAQIIGSGANLLGTYLGGGFDQPKKPLNAPTGLNVKYSDERLKTNIKPIPKADLDEFRSHLKPYFFEYIEKDHGEGEHAGIMAQDLEKSKLGRMAIIEDEKGFKMIDLKKLASICLAAMATGEAA